MGNRYFKNKTTLSPLHKGLANSGSHIIPNSEGIDYPIIHDLGGENVTNSDCSSIAEFGFAFASGVSDGDIITVTTDEELSETLIYFDTNNMNLKRVHVVINITSYPDGYEDSQFQIRDSFGGSTQQHSLYLGINSFEVEVPDFTNTRFIIDAYNLSADDSYGVSEFSIKEITLPSNSFLTAFYPDIGIFKQLSNDGSVGTNVLENGDFSDGYTDWTYNTAGESIIIDNETMYYMFQDDGSTYFANTQGGSIVGEDGRYNIGFEVLENPSSTTNVMLANYSDVNGEQNPLITFSGTGPTSRILNTSVTSLFRFYSNGSGADGLRIDDIYIEEVLPISTIYNMTEAHNMVMQHTVALTDAEEIQLNENPNLWFEVMYNNLVLVDGFNHSYVQKFWGANEGISGGGYVQDLSVDTVEEFDNVEGNWYLNDYGGEGTITYNSNGSITNDTLAGSHLRFRNDSANSLMSDASKMFIMTVEIIERAAGSVYSIFDGDGNPNMHFSDTDPRGIYNYVANGHPDIDRIQFFRRYDEDTLVTYKVLSIREFSGAKILGTYTTANRAEKQSTGPQNVLLDQDYSGRVQGTTLKGHIGITGNDEDVDTQWMPSEDRYSISLKVSGNLEILDSVGAATGTKSQRTETRLLIHDTVKGDKYYINAIDQGYVPTLPNQGQVLALGNIAAIGYPDYIEQIIAPFKVSY